MTDYTIVEPGFEFFEPPNKTNYLEFLERCTRVCYKSEEHIKLGSAEKLMSKVVKEYEHYSVTEHCNAVLKFNDVPSHLVHYLHQHNPLLRTSWRHEGRAIDSLLVSGNIRMWMDLLKVYPDNELSHNIKYCLSKKFPFFWEDKYWDQYTGMVTIVDENPLTNKTGLFRKDAEKHMTLTCKIIGDRSMSHQLVRHRLFAFSQESQRYCNYGKKGFQIVVPPSAQVDPLVKADFVSEATAAYRSYLRLIELGKLKPEDARGLLPNCTKTEVVTTGTLGYWKHIFEHRAHNPKAQWQIREIMLAIEKKFKEILPEVFGE